MSRCLIYGAPVHVYVSLDTIRDYLFAEDAGRRIVAGLRQLAREASNEGLHVTKLYASEREISIAGLWRVSPDRAAQVACGLGAARRRRVATAATAIQVRDLASRWQQTGRAARGVSRVYRHQLVLFRQGLLPPPPLVIARR